MNVAAANRDESSDCRFYLKEQRSELAKLFSAWQGKFTGFEPERWRLSESIKLVGMVFGDVGSSKTLEIRNHFGELLHASVVMSREATEVVLPVESQTDSGRISFSIYVQDAVSPASIGESSDSRILGFGLARVDFQP